MLSLLLLLAAAACVLVAITIAIFANMLLSPPRMTDARALRLLQRLTPDDVGLGYEPLRFRVADQRLGKPIELAAWWMPAREPSDKCVLLLHGFADAKVGSLAWSPMWHELGFNQLAIDLRAHGESEGTQVTAGFFERNDVAQLLAQLQMQRPDQTKLLVLFGVSMGAAVALASACEYQGVSGVVCDSCYSSYASAVRTHSELIHMPLPSLARVMLRFAQWKSGADFSRVAPQSLLAQVPCPVMLIYGGADPFLLDGSLAIMLDALARRHRRQDASLVLETATHNHALAVDPEKYSEAIATFVRFLPPV